jgi:7,8-dihydropterin-6-yl-methyl-4-(beta-D-ribofuranosyl)aminobenzene 5'-phosphate synthase
MIDAVKERYPDRPIVSVIGGFHLMGIPLLKNSMSVTPAEAEQIAREMLDYNIDKVYTMHCTGPRAYAIMKNVMGERLGYLSSGDRVRF